MIKNVVIAFFYKVVNKREFRLLPYLFSPTISINYINRGIKNCVTDPTGMRDRIEKLISKYPSAKIIILKILCDKEFVSVHYKYENLPGDYASPNDSFLDTEYISLFRIVAGKITEQWIYDFELMHTPANIIE